MSLALYLRTNGFMHLRASLVLYALIYVWEKFWNLCLIVVNRSSSLSEWLVNSHVGFDICVNLCLYIFPHFLLFLLKGLSKCKSPTEKRHWAAKAIAHTSNCLGKRESDLYWKCMIPKSQRLVHQIEISKISGINLKMRCIDSKWSNVMNCKEAKWKASKICNYFLIGGHTCSFL